MSVPRAVSVVLLALSGCALGPVRHAKVDALGPWREVSSISVSASPDTAPELAPKVVAAAQSTLLARTHLLPAAPGDPNAFHVEVRAREGIAQEGLDTTLARLTGNATPMVRLSVDATLFAPGEVQRGAVRWEKIGQGDTLAVAGANQSATALAEGFLQRRDEFFDRRAGDERIFLAQTATILQPGEVYLNNDEGLLFSFGVGLGKRVQLNVLLGGLPIPVAGGAVLPPVHIVAGVGGAALGVLGVADIGFKVKILDESAWVPGLTVSYDLIDAFGAVVGAGAGIVLGGGILIAAAPGVAAANVQLNLFTLAVGKHFGHTQVVAGAYVIDNHNFLPQSAGFAVGVFTTGGSTTVSGSAPIPRLPTSVQPFVGVEHVLGPHSALSAELFPRIPVSETFGTTGVRWNIGSDSPGELIAWDRLRLRVDLAALWVYLPPTKSASKGVFLPVPYVGLGLYGL